MEQALILDRYRPLAELGSGGHASVTLAYDTKMGRRVAIKRLPLPLDTAGRVRRIGLAEARTAAMLGHPAIVTVYEWDTDPDEAFIIMEYIEGVSLADVLDRLGRLDLDETSAVLRPVADALAFAHDNGVLHLDIKPENVLVTRDGAVKVADFGIASLTGIGGYATADEGTLGFMPPEQLRGDTLDARADEWALAALTFELVAGANPFTADSAEEALQRAESDSFPGPSQLLRGVPVAVDDVLFAALAPERDERYASVDDFADALLPHLGDPAEGVASLAATVRELTADDLEEEEEAFEHLGLWDRWAWMSPWAARGGAALVGAWLAYLGLAPLALGLAATVVAVLLVAAAGMLAPALGALLALVAFAVGMLRSEAGLLSLLVVLWAAATAWRDRRNPGAVLVSLASPVLAAFRAGPLAPLLLGFTFEPATAAATAAFAGVWTSLFSLAGGHGAPLLTVDFATLADPWPGLAVADLAGGLLTPGPWLVALSWAGAALLMSLGCRRGDRAGAALGTVGAALALLLGYSAWSLMDGRGGVPSTAALQQLIVSLILMAIIVASGPPLRGPGDDDESSEPEAG